MRRSGAPSQLAKGNKRPRFLPPLLGAARAENVPLVKPSNIDSISGIDSCGKSPADERMENGAVATGRSVGDILSLIHTNKDEALQLKCTPVDASLSYHHGNDHHGNPAIHSVHQQLSPREDLSFGNASCSSLGQKENSLNHPRTSDEIQGSVTSSAQTGFRPLGFKGPSSCEDKKLERYVPRFKPVKTSVSGLSRPGAAACDNAPTTSPLTVNQPVSTTVDAQPESLYFNVMWCKHSKKKHKKWEGDAILITKGRSVTLLDMEGKEIGKSTGYKTSELQTLDEGHTLVIGGKEIEVMSKLSCEVFRSGKCFQGAASVSAEPSPPQRKTGLSKPFCRPQKGREASDVLPVVKGGEVRPRHDPAARGALVLPRPPQSHQWDHNQQSLPLVDVVVDPYLSQKLRPHQRDGVLFLYECVTGMKHYNGQGAILADEMGLGKTLQCIALIWTLLRQGPYNGKPVIRKALIITPGSLVKNWVREFKKWLGAERIQVFAVGTDSKVQDFVSSNRYPVMVISYEMFVRSFDVLSKLTFDLIVCDEGHRLKNSTIKTTTLVQSLPARRRVVLSGTPVQNDLQELFSIVDFCNPGILGSAGSFRRVYEEPILASRQPGASPADLALGETRASELNRLTSMFILRRTQDINNKYLPPKVELVLFCQPSALQMALYKQLLSSRTVRSCLSSGDSATHLTCISALRKLCNHPALLYANAGSDDDTGDRVQLEAELYKGLKKLYPENFDPAKVSVEDSGKLQALATLLEKLHAETPREKIVLVSNYTQTLDVLEQVCRRQGYQSLRLDGQTPTAKRQHLVETFNSHYSTDFVFLLSSKAGGVGLNLIGASRLVLYDVDWNPANDLQAMARVWRDGQRRRVYIYRLLTTGSIEEKMYQRQISKQGLSGVVVDAKTNNKMHFSPDELRDLFRVQENTQCATHDLLDCQCDLEDNQQRRAESATNENQARSCQLQQAGLNTKKKNLCMDELLDWHHVAQPELTLHEVDEGIPVGGLPGVTFAFWNEANKAQVELTTDDS